MGYPRILIYQYMNTGASMYTDIVSGSNAPIHVKAFV